MAGVEVSVSRKKQRQTCRKGGEDRKQGLACGSSGKKKIAAGAVSCWGGEEGFRRVMRTEAGVRTLMEEGKSLFTGGRTGEKEGRCEAQPFASECFYSPRKEMAILYLNIKDNKQSEGSWSRLVVLGGEAICFGVGMAGRRRSEATSKLCLRLRGFMGHPMWKGRGKDKKRTRIWQGGDLVSGW